VSPVKYELGFYIPEDNILHSHRRENLKSYASMLLQEIPLFNSFSFVPKNIWILRAL
jgi:hypothetical protein